MAAGFATRANLRFRLLLPTAAARRSRTPDRRARIRRISAASLGAATSSSRSPPGDGTLVFR